jgi:hypothetical protein
MASVDSRSTFFKKLLLTHLALWCCWREIAGL